MTDDPLFGYQPVAPAAPDPLMGFKPAAAPPGAGDTPASFNPPDTLGNMSAFDPRAANSSWKDFLLAHLSELGKGAGQMGGAAADYGRVAANVYGIGDSLAASQKAVYNDITGNARSPNSIANVVNQQVTGQNNANDYLSNLAAERASTEAARERLGTAGTIAANMTGGGPLGSVAQGLRAAPYLSKVPGWVASRIAGGTVGAGSAALGASERGEDVTWPTLTSGVLGTIVGAPTGSAPGPLAQSVEEAKNAEAAAYFPTHSINFPKYQVSDAYYDAAKALSKDQQAGLSPGFNRTVAQHIEENSKTPTTSASEIDGFQRGLNEAARTNADRVLANGVSENLDNVLMNTKPVTPSGDPDPNFATGDAADQLAKAKLAASQRMNAEGIAEAQRVGGLPGGPGIGDVGSSWARGELKANPQFYADPDVNAAMSSVARAGSWLPPSYLFKHALAYPVAGAIAGGAHGYATGGADPWTRAGQEALEMGGAGIAASYGLPAFRNTLVNRALTRAAPTLTAGAPFSPPAPFSDAVRRIIYGQGAAGFQR